MFRVVKQEKGHCGPATIEMALSIYDLDVDQFDIVRAAGIEETVRGNGSRIDQLAKAVKLLNPDYILLAKYNATIADLVELTKYFGLLVGVEWQGVFLDSQGKRFSEGHYSIVESVDEREKTIHIIDPEEKSALHNGKISIEEFKALWWEQNKVPLENDPTKSTIIRNDCLLFIVVPQHNAQTYLNFGLEPASLTFMYKYRV